MGTFELVSFAGADQLARAVAAEWLGEIARLNQTAKKYTVALSGGRIARRFLAAVAELAKTPAISFANVHFFWADERCVSPDEEESNFKIANDILLAPLKIGAAQIHRIHGEEAPEVAAEKAASEAARVAPLNKDGQPVLDLIFLGMGEDGHVASLFPGQIEGADPKLIFCAVKNSPKPPPNRISLGYAPMAAARRVWVLASGAGKEKALRETLLPGGKTPLAKVIQSRSHTRIFIDFPLF